MYRAGWENRAPGNMLPTAILLVAFVAPAPYRAASRSVPVRLAGDGTKGAVGGAVLGGLLAGPFGAIFGAQIGGSMGANKQQQREDEERLTRAGLTKDMIAAANSCAQQLAEAEEGLKVVRSAEGSQRQLVETIERGIKDAYSAAEIALRSGDEAAARTKLEEKAALTRKATAARAELAAATARTVAMQESIGSLSERATQIESKMTQAVSSSSLSAGGQDFDSTFALEVEDPLIAKFRDLESK